MSRAPRAQTSARQPSRDAVFRALGDPTRRAILDRLRHRARGVSELCEPFDMSQPAISQHLKVLADAGLVASTRCGRERVYRLRPQPLRQAYDWLGHFEQFWATTLDRLGAFLDGEPATGAAPDAPAAPGGPVRPTTAHAGSSASRSRHPVGRSRPRRSGNRS